MRGLHICMWLGGEVTCSLGKVLGCRDCFHTEEALDGPPYLIKSVGFVLSEGGVEFIVENSIHFND